MFTNKPAGRFCVLFVFLLTRARTVCVLQVSIVHEVFCFACSKAFSSFLDVSFSRRMLGFGTNVMENSNLLSGS